METLIPESVAVANTGCDDLPGTSIELTQMQDDMMEALDGFQWQYEQKYAELESLRSQTVNDFNESHECQPQKVVVSVSQYMLYAAEALLASRMVELQRQIDYLAGRIQATRMRLGQISQVQASQLRANV
jgi:hypothetical protein